MNKIVKEFLSFSILTFIIIIFNLFVATLVRVSHLSMYPTLNENDILILNKLDRNFKRFDIVVINSNDSKIIKRIIGLPGENIEYKDNKLYIDGKIIDDVVDIKTKEFSLDELYQIDKLPANYYFVMGDNRIKSTDSRDYSIGLIKKTDIVGIVNIRIYPFNKIGKLK